MKTVLILQAWGLGDIIWSQTIAHSFIEKGCKVVWPVKNEYFSGLVDAYPGISWVPESFIKTEIFSIKQKVEVNGVMISPIRWSDSYMQVPYRKVMEAKYMMYELDWKTWRNHSMWVRNFERELSLYNLLGLKPGEKFNLVNTNFGSGVERKIDIKCDNGNKNIELKVIEGYSMFDWTKVILEAEEIHTVSTSLLFMLESLPMFKPIHLYSRVPIEKNLDFVRFLLTKKYILHE